MLIRVWLVDNRPDGIKTLEYSNSTVMGWIVPRHLVHGFAARPEATRPGVYLLIGPHEAKPDVTSLYVGEGDPVVDRIQSHAMHKGFWTRAFVFISKDNYVTKTQIKFLEYQLYQAAKAAGRAELDNVNGPNPPTISEPERVEMVHFFGIIKLLLAAIGITVLEPRETTGPVKVAPENTFEYTVKGATARMAITADGYVVLEGSTALAEPRKSAEPFVLRIREELVNAGVLVPDSTGLLKFTRDTPFDSPSTAAAVVAGGNVNGRLMWKRNGVTLKQLEESGAL